MRIPNKKNQRYHYSPLRYPGGKSFLFPLFDKLIQKRGLSNIVYVEPFAGGAGVGLALLYLERVDTIVINDLDRAIYSFWKSAISETDRFIETILTTPVTTTEWLKQRSIYQSRRPRRFDLGFAAFFLNRTNISGILGGGLIGGLEQKGKWKLDARFNKLALCQRIEQLGMYRNRISVRNSDGLELICDFLDNQDALIYLDPPYYDKGATLYLNHYGESDHESLAAKLNRYSNANWALTYDNNNVIQSLYKNRRRVSYSLHHNAYKSRQGKELLILSDVL